MFIFMFNMTMELVYMGIYRRNINVTISDIDKYKAVYCDLAYLTYMQNASCEMPGWMNYKLESRLSGEISTISDMQMILL